MKYLYRLLLVLASASFFYASAHAQGAGSVTNHAFAIGQGAGNDGYTSLLCTSAQLAVGQAAADPICLTITGDVTITAAGVTAIGASKVTNSQLATMAANTTKCNATAGTTNPTDCNASTMRTNLGLVIGTNVEAWDADLDCLAALSSTGVLSRTGAGTCSAGALALSGLATGTQDTVIGYFGSTTASATAISNCTGALTYSTGTHTFGCNASAGTGTVTSIGLTNTNGLTVSGSPVTTSGNISAGVSLSTATAVLGADVNMGVINTYASGPSMSQGTSGTWWVTGTITINNSAADDHQCKLWDGTTVIASAATNVVAGGRVSVHLGGYLASPAANIRIDCKGLTTATGKMEFNRTGNSKDSSVFGIRIQ
jgi:hypothetical protein